MKTIRFIIPIRRFLSPFAVGIAACFGMAHPVSGAVYTWDSIVSTNWDASTGAANWNNGTGTDVVFPNAPTTLAAASTGAGTGGNTITFGADLSTTVTAGESITGFGLAAGTTVVSVSVTAGVSTVTVSNPLLLINGTTTTAPAGSYLFNANDVFFGVAGATTVNVTANQTVGTLTVNQGSGALTFGGTGTITLLAPNTGGTPGTTALFIGSNTTFNNALNAQGNNDSGILFTSAATLTLLNGGTILGNPANTVQVIGTTAAISQGSTLNVGGTTTSNLGNADYNIGTVTSSGGAVVSTGAQTTGLHYKSGSSTTYSGGWELGRSSNGMQGFAQVEGGATLTLNGGAQVTLGRGGATDMGYLLVNGTVNVSETGQFLGTFVGRNGGIGLLEVGTGGTFTQTSLFNTLLTDFQLGTGDSASSNGTLLIDGGTVTLNNIYFHGNAVTGSGATSVLNAGTAASHGTLTMTSGSLYLGAGGIVDLASGLAGTTINLNGGTLGAIANWSSSVAMNVGGNVAIQAADSVGTGHNIALSGNLTGSGGINKTGLGSLTLSGTNSAYSGTTTITAGSLLVGSGTALGTGGVAFSGGTLGFVGSLTLSQAILTLNSTSVLDFGGGGTDSLTFANSSSATWNGFLNIFNWNGSLDILSFASNSGLTAGQLADIRFYSDGGSTFLGNAAFGTGGNLIVAAPEPGTWALLLGGGTFLAAQGWRRRRSIPIRS